MIPRSLFYPLQIVMRRVRLIMAILILLLVSAIFGIGYLVYSRSVSADQMLRSQVSPRADTATAELPDWSSDYSFDEIQVLFQALVEKENFAAKGIYVVAWDTNQHVFYDLYNQHADIPYNAASMTKLVTALSLAEQAKSDNFIESDSSAASSEGGNLPSALYRQTDLLAALLIQSSNQAAYSLAKMNTGSDFIKRMNAEGDKIGLSHSVFRDPAGLDFGNKNSASYMSPRDVARASFELASRYPELARLSANYTYNIKDRNGTIHTLRNTNPLVKDTPNVILSKTGYTRLAGGNLTMLIEPKPGIWVSIVVAKSTLDQRVPDMKKLVNAVDRTFTVYDSLREIKLAKYP